MSGNSSFTAHAGASIPCWLIAGTCICHPGSLGAARMGIMQFQDIARCLEIWRLRLRDYRRIQNGGHPDESLSRLYHVSVLSLSLGEQGHRGTLPQVILAAVNRMGRNNVKWERQLVRRKNIAAFTALKFRSYETICYRVLQPTSNFNITSLRCLRQKKSRYDLGK